MNRASVAQGGKGVVVPGCALAFTLAQREHLTMDAILQPGQLVRVNLAGLDAGGVTFQAAVTDAVGHILKQTSEQPPKYLVELRSCRCQRPTRKRYRHQASSAWTPNSDEADPKRI